MKTLLKIAGLSLLIIWSCQVKHDQAIIPALSSDQEVSDTPSTEETLTLRSDVTLNHYFEYMDSLLRQLNTGRNYSIDEYMLVHHNSWIIDSLVNTDYYLLKSRGVISLDPLALKVLRAGQVLSIPDSINTVRMKKWRETVAIDINIPEYKLRILDKNQCLYTFPVRVGRPALKYLAMSGRETNLRTHIGKGKIVRINKKPTFINPADNHVYSTTRRDDGTRTKLPNVPWLEPEINGQRFGQLIHPTTNPATLGKAYSNGCIGLQEGDMWRVYYYAPIGTRVIIRYDLDIIDQQGDSIRLKDIYRDFTSLTSVNHDKTYYACNCELNEDVR